ncbi:hypothetical protein CHS0354_030427 [Potamilus streckersoni]|uniref:Sulfotransferase domain-containing protein n=1 Tax=Potamilus streckersoni TaxID=2493646 RepID=A0AAE0S8C1_9BIVA|nr:hypothetical protein CHS0354_030427 [Potamilus streckersoni]
MIIKRRWKHTVCFVLILSLWMLVIYRFLRWSEQEDSRLLHQGVPDKHAYLRKPSEMSTAEHFGQFERSEKIEDIINWSDQYLMTKGPFQFLENFRNPCFFSDVGRLSCLPYFFIIGEPKCGTTDLYVSLRQHPEISWEHKKEVNYFSNRRFETGSNYWTFERYLDEFLRSTAAISTTISRIPCRDSWKDCDYHPLITGDGTVRMLGDKQYEFFRNNITQKEPNLTNADILFHLNPNTKLIIILRNPIERAYSDYHFNSWVRRLFNASLEHFHTTMVEQISRFTKCCQATSIRSCAYQHGEVPFKERFLRLGVYYIFIKDWLRVFPRHQILILRFEDWAKNKRQTYNEILKFLDIRQLTIAEENLLVSRPNLNQRPSYLQMIGDMYPKTRELLRGFYAPHNEELARLLSDSRFLWI